MLLQVAQTAGQHVEAGADALAVPHVPEESKALHEGRDGAVPQFWGEGGREGNSVTVGR